MNKNEKGKTLVYKFTVLNNLVCWKNIADLMFIIDLVLQMNRCIFDEFYVFAKLKVYKDYYNEKMFERILNMCRNNAQFVV